MATKSGGTSTNKKSTGTTKKDSGRDSDYQMVEIISLPGDKKKKA